MKRIAALIATAVLSMKASAGNLYSFEELSQQHQGVPAAVSVLLRQLAAEPIKDCKGQLNLSDEQMQSYFTSTAVALPGSDAKALLVVPTQYCYAFFGAHAVAFWLFLIEPTGPKLVLANSQDALEVLEPKLHKLPDVSTHYGTSEIKYRYNGKQYVPLSE